MPIMLILNLQPGEVIRIGECEIRTKAKRENTLQHIYASITQSSNIEHYQSNEIISESIAAEPPIPYGEPMDFPPTKEH